MYTERGSKIGGTHAVFNVMEEIGEMLTARQHTAGGAADGGIIGRRRESPDFHVVAFRQLVSFNKNQTTMRIEYYNNCLM